MSTANQVKIVLMKELGNNILAEGEGDTTVVLTPSINVLIRVRPEKIAKQASIGNIGGTAPGLRYTVGYGPESIYSVGGR